MIWSGLLATPEMTWNMRSVSPTRQGRNLAFSQRFESTASMQLPGVTFHKWLLFANCGHICPFSMALVCSCMGCSLFQLVKYVKVNARGNYQLVGCEFGETGPRNNGSRSISHYNGYILQCSFGMFLCRLVVPNNLVMPRLMPLYLHLFFLCFVCLLYQLYYKHWHMCVLMFLHTDTVMLHDLVKSVEDQVCSLKGWIERWCQTLTRLSSPHGHIHNVLLQKQGFQFVSFPQEHESVMRGLNSAMGGLSLSRWCICILYKL